MGLTSLKGLRKADEDKKKIQFDDIHDIEEHLLTVHSFDLLEILSDDLVLAYIDDDKEREFISNNIQNAHEALNMIKDKTFAKYCATRLLLKAYTLAVMRRNKKGNPLIELILKRKDELMQQEEQNIDEKIMEKIDKKTEG